MPKKSTLKKVIDSLVAHYESLGYADAGFNIHDCSDSMHESDELTCSIDSLEHIVDGELDEALCVRCEDAYIKGYAKYTVDHDIFADESFNAEALTPVSSGTYVDFDDPDVWSKFVESYNAQLNAA